MKTPLCSYESDFYEYEIHHPTKPLALCKGNKWGKILPYYNSIKKRLVFDTKEEAFSYLNSIRHQGKVMELYHINNYYDDYFNSVLHEREIKEKNDYL